MEPEDIIPANQHTAACSILLFSLLWINSDGNSSILGPPFCSGLNGLFTAKHFKWLEGTYSRTTVLSKWGGAGMETLGGLFCKGCETVNLSVFRSTWWTMQYSSSPLNMLCIHLRKHIRTLNGSGKSGI